MLLATPLRRQYIARHHGGFGETGKEKRFHDTRACLAFGVDRGADRRRIFRCRFEHRAGTSLVGNAKDAKLHYLLFNTISDQLGAVTLARFKIAESKLWEYDSPEITKCDRLSMPVPVKLGRRLLADSRRLVREA